MASQGSKRVTPVHCDALAKKYRRLLGERIFWAKRARHPQSSVELERINATLDALRCALRAVAPDLKISNLTPLRFALAVPVPGLSLTRVTLAGLRKLGPATADELACYVVESQHIDTELHDVHRLERRVQRVLDGLTTKGSLKVIPGASPRWALLA